MEAKNECDKVIDKNGTPKTGGNGIKQLRDNIHKYYYLILFTAYMREAADKARNSVSDEQKAELTLTSGKCAIPGNQLKLARTFVDFMEENSALRTLIDTGKGDLQWERDIPPASLSNLEGLAKGDFQANLGKIVHDIYQNAEVEGLIEKKAITLDLYEILGKCTWKPV